MASIADRGAADLRAYYDAEARGLLRLAHGPRRQELLQRYVHVLASEGRGSVLDLGAGPGLDVTEFAAAGLRAVGVDLAPANAALAASRGVTVVPGDVGSPPIRARSFEAGWSMSTLMHLDAGALAAAVDAIRRPFVAGAPLWVGLWGGPGHDHDDDRTIEGQRRRFALRPLDENRRLVAQLGPIEHDEVWDVGPDDWEYQVICVRIAPAGPSANNASGVPGPVGRG